jgi:hypothetical protein
VHRVHRGVDRCHVPRRGRDSLERIHVR